MFTALRSLLTGVVACLASATLAQPRFDLATTETRLPKTVLPSRVALSLDLDPAKDTFGGEVRMALRVLKPVDAIVLHARDLQAESAEVRHGRQPPRRLKVAPDAATQTWRLTPEDGRPLRAGLSTLSIRYRGVVQRTGEGLYRADYRIDGQPARMLATQLEAVDARRLLPAFDEPVFRSVFQLEVRAPSDMQVLANMPSLSATPSGATTLHRFAPTPSMPVYLLAVTVGRFDALEDQVDGIPLHIFTVPGKREQAQLAMAATRQVLPFYAGYFGRPYALPKLDQVAVPGTRQGAMEDWGLISHVEDALLFDAARSDEMTRRTVFRVVAHEIAHQWFGNLVSAASWDEIWLNEAFATWMQDKAAAHFHPEWQTGLRSRRELDFAMARDASPATRAIRSGPVSEAAVFDVFDNITYSKGGAVLTMLEQWVGEAAFQRGLAAYMAERAFQPATAGDLWHHIARAAGMSAAHVGAVAATWTDQAGLPVLGASQRCEHEQTMLTLRQGRFADGDALAGGPWSIPLRIARGASSQRLLMTSQETVVTLPGCDTAPLLVNAGGSAYLRVDYDAELAQRLTDGFATLAPADRIALVSDGFALAKAGRRPMAGQLALLGSVPRVVDASRAALFEMAATQWRVLDVALAGSAATAPLRSRGIALFAPELERLGWDEAPGEAAETRALRPQLVSLLARFDHAPVIAAARARFDAALAGAATVAPSTRWAVLYAAGRDASEAEFDALLAALRSTQQQEERWVLLEALGATRDAARAQRLLDEALSGRLPQDIASSVAGTLASQPEFAPLAYRFVVKNWDAMLRIAGEGSFGTRHGLLPSAARTFADAASADQLIVDQRRLDGAAGDSLAAQVAAEIRARSRLREREAAVLGAALAR